MTAKRIILGQKIGRQFPAGRINYAHDRLDRIEAVLGNPPGPADTMSIDGHPVLVALAKNVSGSDLVERAIVGVKESAFDLPDIEEGSSPPYDDDNEADDVVLGSPAIEIVSPNETTHASKWVVTLEPILNGECGAVAVMGLVAVRVNVSDEDHEFAKIKTGDTIYLESAASGGVPIWYRKLQDESEGTGKQWALVLLGGGGGGGDITTHWGIISETVGQATGDRSEVTPGQGKVHIGYSTNSETGVRTRPEEPTVAVALNYYKSPTYYEGTPVELAKLPFKFTIGEEELDVYEVLAGDCDTFSEPEEEEE